MSEHVFTSQAQSGLAHGTLQSTFRLPRLKMRPVAATKCMSAFKWLDNVMVSLHCWLVMFTHPVWNLHHEENFLNSTRGNISTRCFRTELCKNHGFACLTDVWQLFHVTQNALRAGFVALNSAMAVPGLEDELRKAGLERCLEAAVDWCERSSWWVTAGWCSWVRCQNVICLMSSTCLQGLQVLIWGPRGCAFSQACLLKH